MKKKRMTATLLLTAARAALVLIAALAFLVCGGCAPQAAAPGEKPSDIKTSGAADQLEPVAGDESFSLWINKKTCQMEIRDGDTAYTAVWGELPEELEQNAVGPKLQSHLLVSYINDSNSASETSSKVSSVGRGTYKIETIANGIRITFDFSREREQFVIPVEYVLEGRELKATVCTRDIVEYGVNRITAISLLPGFFSGAREEEGELLLPDGSGAVMDFGQRNKGVLPVKMEVYGRDPALNLAKVVSNKEACRLPVYGMSKGGSGVLAVLEEGAPLARIVCNPVKADMPAGNVYPEFRYRAMDTVTLADQSFKSKDSTVSAPVPETSAYGVRYLFETGRPGYESLALRYREYLRAGDGTAGPRGVYVESFGAVAKKASLLGVVYDRVEAVTTFDDLTAMAERLREAGEVPCTFLLEGFHSGGYGAGATSKADILGVTGGRVGLTAFTEALGDTGKVYLGGQFACDSREKPFGAYAKSIFSETLFRNVYSLSLGIKEEEWGQPLFKNAKALEQAESYLRSVAGLPVDGVYFTDMGSELYSDFDKDRPVGRDQAMALQKALLDTAARQGAVAVDGANAYALDAAAAALNVPFESSHFTLETRSVPFLQVALSGVTDLVARPLNNQADMESAFIRTAALGMSLQFRLTGRDNLAYKETRLSSLYDTGFAGWEEAVSQYTARFAEISARLGDSEITACVSPVPEVYRVTYSNGTVILANAGAQPYDWDGQTLPAYSLEITDGN